MRSLLTIGSFDTLHLDHIRLFDQCRRLIGSDGRLIVGVNSDGFYKSYRGYQPLMPEDVRVGVINRLEVVDEVIVNYGGSNQAALINKVNPDILAIGTDWATRDYYGQLGITQEWLDERDIQLVYLPHGTRYSSTEIKKRLG